jgi:hypothetical protein
MMAQYPNNKQKMKKREEKKVNFTTKLKRKVILSIAYVIHKMRFVD